MNVMVQDDSDRNGPYIAKWDVSGLAKPTNSQLNAGKFGSRCSRLAKFFKLI